MKALPIFILTLAIQSLSAADLKFAGIFTDHAVLQRGKPVPVWGWAAANENVEVSFAGKTQTATAGADGYWFVRLDAMEANANGQTLTATAGSESVSLEDILVGEVWHAAGQSNMKGTLHPGKYDRFEHTEDAKADIAYLNGNPSIRFFEAAYKPSPEPLAEFDKALDEADSKSADRNQWNLINDETLRQFSETAAFFATKLHQELNVPIGIIVTAQGAKRIAVFMSEEIGGSTTSYFNSRISPMISYGLAGTIWYQGESDAIKEYAKSIAYKDRLTNMIADYREKNDFPEMPFYLMQIGSQGKFDFIEYKMTSQCVVQDQQRRVVDTMPFTGLAVFNDMNGNHPANKRYAGHRLAAHALAKTYGFDIPHESPLYKGHTVEGNTVIVEFKHAESGLTQFDRDANGGFGEPIPNTSGVSDKFEVAGEDLVWQRATAKLVGSKVEASSPEVPNPVHVRYAWQQTLKGDRVFNKDGFPMATFMSAPVETEIPTMEHYFEVRLPELNKKLEALKSQARAEQEKK